MNSAAKFRLGVLILGLAGFAAADTLPPVWEPVGATAITSWNSINDGVGLATVDLPFAFPLFGEDYTSVTISSGGSIYFGGAPNTADPQASVSGFLQGMPQITAAWYATDAIDGSGTILENVLSGQVVFTWENVSSYAPPAGQSVSPSNLATFQVTLDNNGDVIFAYQALNSLNPSTTGVVNSLVGSPLAIVGITDGYGATDPGSEDLSVLGTSPGFFLSTATNTVYQAVDNNPPDNSNFAGLDLILTPQTGVGWQVTSYYTTQNGQSVVPEPGTCLDIAASVVAFLTLWYRGSAASDRTSGETGERG